MVNKIISYASKYKGKRIAVLTGLNHKYFLVDKLAKEPNIELKEITRF
jgi:translation initiation factor 1 (eIF-1/SUI1)